MPSAAEAEAALVAARETGLEATVGFVCGPDGRLLSGEELATAVARVEPHGPVAILVNCAAPPVIAVALAELRRSTVVATGGYANVGVVNATYGWAADAAITPEVYAAFATGWLELGARLVGGCCGTTPAHTAALRVLIDQVAGHGASATAWGR